MGETYTAANAGAKRKVVIEIAEEHIGTVDDVRTALRKRIDDVTDEQLSCARGIQVLLMC
ncbi:hypothetical protein [Streptosporangium sp. CA-115845]|uniref:hypothetical protein n=1 Tax=Streptosporangium sp. CA-115845 TaxID=3240071 RepID=UPI003D950601